MRCMKCGRKGPVGTVFCEDCQAGMEKYPVDADTPVLLPNRPHTAPPKRGRNRRPEEVNTSLRNWVRFLFVLCLVLILALSATVLLLLKRPEAPPDSTPDPGQNYGTAASSESSSMPSTGSTGLTEPTGTTEAAGGAETPAE